MRTLQTGENTKTPWWRSSAMFRLLYRLGIGLTIISGIACLLRTLGLVDTLQRYYVILLLLAICMWFASLIFDYEFKRVSDLETAKLTKKSDHDEHDNCLGHRKTLKVIRYGQNSYEDIPSDKGNNK